MPVFSIPSDYGIGSFSKEAYEFVDKLKCANQKYWQILPLNPTSYGDSPYQSFSTFAGNPLFIDIENIGVDKTDLDKLKCMENDTISYENAKLIKEKALKISFKNTFDENDKKYQQFVKKNAFWLEDYSLYMALKTHFNGKEWDRWDEGIKTRKKEFVAHFKDELKNDISYHKYVQFLFFGQWHKLKKYANSKGIEIIGDIPIYVAYDSSDVWANPNLFKLDKNLKPTLLAGCPPDDFSKKGQLWGNPVYNWKANKSTGYNWWIERLEFALKQCDVLRIDHFRGFESFYAVKNGSTDATNGKWYKGCGYSLFECLKEKTGDINVIAEDLGFITDSVKRLLKKTGFYGMKIFQFAFENGKITADIPFLYKSNCVAYTGTHDNDTVMSWYNSLKNKDRLNVNEFITNKEKINVSLIKTVLLSNADVVIIPVADYLGLSKEGRINTPSTMGANWKWKMKKDALTDDIISDMKHLAILSKRT